MDRTRIPRPKRQRHLGGDRQLEVGRHILHGIQNRHVIAGMFALPVKRTIGVHRWIAPVARDEIMQILLLIVPVAQGDDDVALGALGPRRLGVGQLPIGDALGPVAQIFQRHGVELARDQIDHALARLAGLDAPHPGVFVTGEFAKRLGNGARGQLPQLMAAHAAIALENVEIAVLAMVLGNIPIAAELAGLRDVHHGVPIDRRVILGRLRLGRRHRCRMVDDLAGLALHLGGIDKAVAAHPNVIIRLGQIGDDIAALIIGHHAADEAHAQLARLGDDPDARLRPLGAGDHPADVIIVDGGRLLRLR